MSYDPQAKPEEKKSIFGVIVHSFFVVPFLLAVFSVLLFAAVRILTMEKRSAFDYLSDVKSGGVTKRWQSAFELSRILSAKDSIVHDEKFVTQMIAAYEASSHDDERVRQYLTMAMARTGNIRFADVLLKNIANEKDENLYAIISGLGILKSVEAVNVLLKYLDHDNVRIRLAAVIALGNIGDAKSILDLKRKLDDAEPNVTWDAAIALAKLNDRSGKAMILKLLDRSYLNQFKNVDSMQQSKIIQVAIGITQHWNDPDINMVLKKLFESDPNMIVRDLAHKSLQQNS